MGAILIEVLGGFVAVAVVVILTNKLYKKSRAKLGRSIGSGELFKYEQGEVVFRKRFAHTYPSRNSYFKNLVKPK